MYVCMNYVCMYVYICMYACMQRRTNIFWGVGAEAEGGLTSRGSGGRSPPDADDNIAVTQFKIIIILLLS